MDISIEKLKKEKFDTIMNFCPVDRDDYEIAHEMVKEYLEIFEADMRAKKNEAEIKKVEAEIKKVEAEIKRADVDARMKQIQLGIEGAKILVTVWGTLKTLQFEKTGTVTTIAGKNLIKKLF